LIHKTHVNKRSECNNYGHSLKGKPPLVLWAKSVGFVQWSGKRLLIHEGWLPKWSKLNSPSSCRHLALLVVHKGRLQRGGEVWSDVDTCRQWGG